MEKKQQKISYPEFVAQNWVDSMKRSFDFSGKTTRKEYWSLALANFILSILILLFVPFLGGLFQLATFFQSLSALARRYRDAGLTPWLMIFILPSLIVPFLGSKNPEKNKKD
jgi:uncharacterized membrane protein YhaH (DUF805 family)